MRRKGNKGEYTAEWKLDGERLLMHFRRGTHRPAALQPCSPATLQPCNPATLHPCLERLLTA